MPISLFFLLQIDPRFIFFISDLYYSITGLIVTFSGISWSFSKYSNSSTITKKLLLELKLTQINLAKFAIASVGIESLIITINLLPLTLGFFILRFLIIVSGITGIYSPIELIINIIWILEYQIIFFFWIFILRMIWILLQNTRMNLIGAGFAYVFIIIDFLLKSTRLSSIKLVIYDINALGLLFTSITGLKFWGGWFHIIGEIVKMYGDTVREATYSDFGDNSLLVIFLLLNLISVYLINMKSKLDKIPKRKLIKKIIIVCLEYFGCYILVKGICLVSPTFCFMLTLFIYPIGWLLSIIYTFFQSLISFANSAISTSVFINTFIGFQMSKISGNPLDMFLIYYTIDYSGEIFTHNYLKHTPLLPTISENSVTAFNSIQIHYLPENVFNFYIQIISTLGPIFYCWILCWILSWQLKDRKKKR